MKQYILLLVLMVMGAGIHAYAEDVNPVKEGNVISGHVVEKGTENSLPYATILIVETGEGTVSNERGRGVPFQEGSGRKVHIEGSATGL